MPFNGIGYKISSHLNNNPLQFSILALTRDKNLEWSIYPGSEHMVFNFERVNLLFFGPECNSKKHSPTVLYFNVYVSNTGKLILSHRA